jgi:hypothetical protein
MIVFKRPTAATALAVSALLCSGAPSVAQTRSAEYVSVSPGLYVEYLSLIDSGNYVSGFLESVRISKFSPDGEERTLMSVSAKSNGDIIVFGDRTATRTAKGYMLTYAMSTGEAGQQEFTRSTIQQINTSIRDLSAGVKQNQTMSALAAAKAELSTISKSAITQAQRIAQLQSIIDAATVKQAALQHEAEPLVGIARALREKAMAMLDIAGASWTENQLRVAAMKNADDANETARIAQRDADASGETAAHARADLNDVRIRIARLNERARVLTATINGSRNLASVAPEGDMTSSGDVAGR